MPRSMLSADRASQAGPPFHLQNSGPARLKPSRAVCCVNVSSGGTWKYPLPSSFSPSKTNGANQLSCRPGSAFLPGAAGWPSDSRCMNGPTIVV